MRHNLFTKALRVLACCLLLANAFVQPIMLYAADTDEVSTTNVVADQINNDLGSTTNTVAYTVIGDPNCTDNDNDGICAEDDCNDSNRLPGASYDTDGDGVCNNFDACDELQGPASNNGCPVDEVDLCSNVDCGTQTRTCSYGSNKTCSNSCSNGTCSTCTPAACDTPIEVGPCDTQGGDSDDDGVCNNTDQCDYQAGPSSNNGCPVVDLCANVNCGTETRSCSYGPSKTCVNSCSNGSCSTCTPAACDVAPDPCRLQGGDGDGDGICNDSDQCDFQAGPASNNGCPIIVNQCAGVSCSDTVRQCSYGPNKSCTNSCTNGTCGTCVPAACDLEPTPCKNNGGDSDRDGVCADVDCNDNNPLPGASTDTDGDGVCNDKDVCDEDAGPANNNGCPVNSPCLLSGGDSDSDGVCANIDCDDTDASNTDKQPNCKNDETIDPMVKVSCVLNGHAFDLNNPPASLSTSCGETIECGVWFSNKSGGEASQGFAGSVSVSGGTIIHSLSQSTNGISCSKQGSSTYTCSGTLGAGQDEDLFLTIDLPDCGCEESTSLQVSASMQVANDTNSSNNSGSVTVRGTGDICIETCNGQGGDSDNDGICDEKDLCVGVTSSNNEDKDKDFIGDVCDNCPSVRNLDQKDTNNNGIGDACEQTSLCKAPITSLTIDSHNDLQEVTSSTIIVSGTVLPGTSKVQVNGNTASINGSTWSRTVTLSEGMNTITVTATPVDELCSTVTKTIKITYKPFVGVTTTCDATSLVPKSIQEGESFAITCEGTNVSTYTVTVKRNGAVVSTSPLINPNSSGNGTWTYKPLVDGSFTFTCKAQGATNNAVCNDETGVVLVPDSVTECTDTTVTPSSVTIGQGTFTVACNGSNVDEFEIKVAKDGNVISSSGKLTAINDSVSWAYSPLVAGAFDFQCIAYGAKNFDSCLVKSGIAKPPVDECKEPITSLSVTSHSNNQSVSTNKITLQGSVLPGQSEIFVVNTSKGSTLEKATVTGSSRSIMMNLVEGDNNFKIIADPKDSKCTEKTIWFTIKYTPQLITECTDSTVSPSEIVLGDESFTIVCEGTNVDYFTVKVAKDGQLITTSERLLDTDKNDKESWTFKPTQTGIYSFECTASGQANFDTCSVNTGKVVPPAICQEPVVLLSVESHSDGDIVDTNMIILTGKVDTGNSLVTVKDTINDTLYSATVTGNSRSAKVNLINGANVFKIIADPSDVQCSEKSIWFTINYEPKKSTICTDTISTPEKVKVNESITVSCKGTDVDSFEIMVSKDGTTLVTSPVLPDSNNNDMVTWTYSPSSTGTFVFTCIANGQLDTDTCPADSVVVESGIGTTCDEPITKLTIESHTANQETFSGSIILTGDVVPGSASVEVINTTTNNTVTATIVGTIWTATVPLQVGSNNINVVADPADVYCSSETTSITLIRKTSTNACTDQLTVTIDAPVNNFSTRNDSVVVNGTVNNPSAIVTVDGQTVVVNSNGSFTATVLLPNIGSKTIAITAKNGDVNCDTTENRTVTRTRTSTGGSGGGRSSSIVCGNGKIDTQYNETCDDGNRYNGDGCDSTCRIEDPKVCGNGIVEIGEQCDDNNRNNGDGCNNSCRIEEVEIEKRLPQIKTRPQPLAFPQTPAPKILPKTGNLERFTPRRVVAQ